MKTLLTLILCLFTSTIFAQTWEFVEKNELDDSLVILKFLPTSGSVSGTIIKVDEEKTYKDYVYYEILTCKHLILDENEQEKQGKILVKFNNNLESNVSIVRKGKDADVMIVSAYGPKGLKVAEVAEEDDRPLIGEELIIRGFGNNHYDKIDFSKIRSFKGILTEHIYNEHVNILDVPFIPGDSGGSVFKDGKIVGVVSGGFHWFSRKDIENKNYTWPAIISNLSEVRKILK